MLPDDDKLLEWLKVTLSFSLIPFWAFTSFFCIMYTLHNYLSIFYHLLTDKLIELID